MSRKSFSIFIIVCTALFLGCENKETISYVNKDMVTDNCTDCPQVKINIPQAQPANAVTEKINTEINSFVIDVLNYSEEKKASTINEAIAIFRNDYKKLKERFPEDIVPWEASIKGGTSFKNGHFSSIKIESYVFTGGAHGYGSVSFLNFNDLTGEALSAEDLFTNVDAFVNYAEEAFRKQENLKPEANINSSGFMFENDAFHLPNSIGFNGQGIVLIYNPYEIAAYADGLTKIEIPYSKAEEFMKPEWLAEAQ
ncbi:DUF3298 and DUF4163 domain-containing protein [Galbibacter pacificus]|uniref:DUF4163 domain-containing protein n=1 Tax=Galbibacter pacificus TaxID=2996052 RepID=A0ABT6FTP0_9FLAO|nr:DUF3298 and DUF4163 domain-containing protein [Galbibacter pacificus]MDG3583152.1 DUF4163 domain-containing protein [Galbibacter pacificus]MDG3586633.1 DUF4163 domain-containing protein [Galbibacter pacificus]